jgi:hypothetical protein
MQLVLQQISHVVRNVFDNAWQHPRHMGYMVAMASGHIVGGRPLL